MIKKYKLKGCENMEKNLSLMGERQIIYIYETTNDDKLVVIVRRNDEAIC